MVADQVCVCRGNIAAGSDLDGYAVGFAQGPSASPGQIANGDLVAFEGNTAHSNQRHGVVCCGDMGAPSLVNATLAVQQLLRYSHGLVMIPTLSPTVSHDVGSAMHQLAGKCPLDPPACWPVCTMHIALFATHAHLRMCPALWATLGAMAC